MTPFVLDASVALAWFVDDPVPSYAVQIRNVVQHGTKAIVPTLWTLEMANGLSMAERRGKLAAAEADRALEQLELLVRSGIEIDTGVLSVREAFITARTFQLTAYDAAYLELAQREGLPLATLDKGLRTAAAKAGIPAM